MLTNEEAYEEYRINAAEAERAEGKARSSRQSLSSYKEQKSNFEGCLEGVKEIILFFQRNVSEALDETNCSGRQADECYVAAISCDTIHSASISSAFYSKSIDEDELMLSPAYQCCVKEKDRLESEIERLAGAIQNTREAIRALDSAAKRYGEAADEYYAQWQLGGG